MQLTDPVDLSELEIFFRMFLVVCFMFIARTCCMSIASRWITKRKKAAREQRESDELAAWRQTSEGARVVQLAAHVVGAIDKEAYRRAKFTAVKEVSVALEDDYKSPVSDLDLLGLERPTSSSEMQIYKGALAAEREKIVKELILEVMELGFDAKRSPVAVMGLQSISKPPNEPLQYARLWVHLPQPGSGRRRTWNEWRKNPRPKESLEHHYRIFQTWVWDKADESK